MINKGKILDSVVRKLHPNISELAKKLGYTSRTTIYRHFLSDDLPDGLILKYAKALNYDFKAEFPSLYAYNRVSEPEAEYGRTREELITEVKFYKELYYKSLEEKNKLLEELLEIKREKK